MFRPYPTSLYPEGDVCAICDRTPSHWFFMAVRLVSTIMEFDVYRPSCGCQFFIESPRLVGFFEIDDYGTSPMLKIRELYNLDFTASGIIISPKSEEDPPECDGDCDICSLSD